MRTLFTVGLGFAAMLSTVAGARAQDAAASTDAAPKREGPLSVEVGAGGGIDFATGGLGIGPAFFVEGGAAYAIDVGAITGALRLGFSTFSTDGNGKKPCGATGPCVASSGGAYDWSLDATAVTLSLPIGVRFLPSDRLVIPYATVAPGIYFIGLTSTAYDNESTQGKTSFGAAFAAGSRLRLGPGGLFLELGYQFASLHAEDDTTGLSLAGSSDLGAFTMALGYRLTI